VLPVLKFLRRRAGKDVVGGWVEGLLGGTRLVLIIPQFEIKQEA
jgi:hypothetical protein